MRVATLTLNPKSVQLKLDHKPMVFSTESTAFTKKEKRTKKERKAAAADSLTAYINLALYTYKGLGGEGECRTVTACACLSASGALLQPLLELDAACIAPPHPWPLSLVGARGTEIV